MTDILCKLAGTHSTLSPSLPSGSPGLSMGRTAEGQLPLPCRSAQAQGPWNTCHFLGDVWWVAWIHFIRRRPAAIWSWVCSLTKHSSTQSASGVAFTALCSHGDGHSVPLANWSLAIILICLQWGTPKFQPLSLGQHTVGAQYMLVKWMSRQIQKPSK